MQLRRILILIVVFFATFPISMIVSVFVPGLGIVIFDALYRHSGSHFSEFLIDVSNYSSIILISLFFTFVAWLFMAQTKNQKTPILVIVFFATLPVSLILNLISPLTRLISDLLVPVTRDLLSSFYVPLLTLTVLTSLFFTFIARFLIRVKRNPQRQLGERTEEISP